MAIGNVLALIINDRKFANVEASQVITMWLIHKSNKQNYFEIIFLLGIRIIHVELNY